MGRGVGRLCVLPLGEDLTGPLDTQPAKGGISSQCILKQTPPRTREGQEARPQLQA